jgi:hypothetical protein
MSKKTNPVVRTERGWPGHFICADRCMFRRNTLLECGETRIIVSTVGSYTPPKPKGVKITAEIGMGRFYETMAFRATWDGTYWDTDIDHPVQFNSPWTVNRLDYKTDEEANVMHEVVVEELTRQLQDKSKETTKED